MMKKRKNRLFHSPTPYSGIFTNQLIVLLILFFFFFSKNLLFSVKFILIKY